jgi:hypothetical protein
LIRFHLFTPLTKAAVVNHPTRHDAPTRQDEALSPLRADRPSSSMLRSSTAQAGPPPQTTTRERLVAIAIDIAHVGHSQNAPFLHHVAADDHHHQHIIINLNVVAIFVPFDIFAVSTSIFLATPSTLAPSSPSTPSADSSYVRRA